MLSTLPKPNFNVSVTFILSSAYAFNLNKSKILSFGKGLSLHYGRGDLLYCNYTSLSDSLHMTNFSLVYHQSVCICRRDIDIGSDNKIYLLKDTKHRGKIRNAGYQCFLPLKRQILKFVPQCLLYSFKQRNRHFNF